MTDLTLKIGAVTIAEAERRLILETLRHMKGDKMRAAIALGIGLTTIYAKLRNYQTPIAKSETKAVK